MKFPERTTSIRFIEKSNGHKTEQHRHVCARRGWTVKFYFFIFDHDSIYLNNEEDFYRVLGAMCVSDSLHNFHYHFLFSRSLFRFSSVGYFCLVLTQESSVSD